MNFINFVTVAILLSLVAFLFLRHRVKKHYSSSVQILKIMGDFLPPGITVHKVYFSEPLFGSVKHVTLYVNLEDIEILTEDVLSKIRTAVYRKLDFLPNFQIEEYEPEWCR